MRLETQKFPGAMDAKMHLFLSSGLYRRFRNRTESC